MLLPIGRGGVDVALAGSDMAARIRRGADGFTLVEVLVATTLLVTLAVGVAQLFAMATLAGAGARDQTSTAILAAGKLEQLRSLRWSYDATTAGPVPRSDTSTNLSLEIPDDSGPGLTPSPPGTLTSSIPPYVDYLDSNGRWVGNGAWVPPRAMYVRRWAVAPLSLDPQRTLVLTVRVTTIAADAGRGYAAWRGRVGSEALVVALKTRRGG